MRSLPFLGRVVLLSLLAAGASGPHAAAQVPGAQGGEARPPVGGVVMRNAPLRMGVTVQPDSVTVGQPFIVSIRVQAPAGAVVEFPDTPDSSFAVQALDPARIGESADSNVVDRTALYRVAAWDTGPQVVTFPAVRVTTGDAARDLTVDEVPIFVQTVLPADSAEHIPRPARDLFEFPGPWWLPWLLGLLVAGLVGLLLWWLWRRRRHSAAAPQADPFAEAEAAFDAVDSLRLLELGERSRHVALMTEVLRDYLAARDPATPGSLTTGELISALRESELVPVDRLEVLLGEADLVKFANLTPGTEHARELGESVRAIVRFVESARAAAMAEALERAEREARAGGAREAA